jgi:hypothetical protein
MAISSPFPRSKIVEQGSRKEAERIAIGVGCFDDVGYVRCYVRITLDNCRSSNIIFSHLPCPLLAWCWDIQGGDYVHDTFGDQQDPRLAKRLELRF